MALNPAIAISGSHSASVARKCEKCITIAYPQFRAVAVAQVVAQIMVPCVNKFRCIFLGFALVIIEALTFSSAIAVTDCASKACVSVVTDPAHGGIIIWAVQHSPGSVVAPPPTPPAVKKVQRIIRRPAATIPKPKPVVKAHVPRTGSTSTVKKVSAIKPTPSQSIAPKVVAAASLSDSLTALLPGRNIVFAPNPIAVPGIPVYFWTDSTDFFTTATTILGIVVGVSLQPSYTWNFGDGSATITTRSSTVYPSIGLAHTYARNGSYTISLAISWAGSWSADGNVFPVLGNAIVQNTSTTIQVKTAPTNYLH